MQWERFIWYKQMMKWLMFLNGKKRDTFLHKWLHILQKIRLLPWIHCLWCYIKACANQSYIPPANVVVNVFRHVCLSVCLSVQAITFKSLHIETSFLVCSDICTISRSSLSIKVIWSRSYKKNDDFTYFNMLILCIWLQVINKDKVTHQGEGHIKFKVKISTSHSILCHLFCPCIYLKVINGNKVRVMSRSRWNEVEKYQGVKEFHMLAHIGCL